MINISIPKDREDLEQFIADDIEVYCANNYEHGHRNHLGASELGEACHRKLWYKFRWAKEEIFDGRMLRLFNVGHQAEPRFISYLRGIGFEVKEYADTVLNYHPESGGYWWSETFDPGDGLVENVTEILRHEAEAAAQGIKPKQIRISGAKGHYGGSLDGMCKAPARYEITEDLIFLNEFKTNNTGSGFIAVATQPLSKSKPKHWAQMCQYGYKKSIRYGLYMIENKNDSSLTIKIVELDWNYGKQLEQKAEGIIFSKEPPPRISDNPAMLDCKNCHLARICHKGESPEKNCRSCRQAEPVDNSEWFCNKHQAIIPKDWIKKGCEEWLPI